MATETSTSRWVIASIVALAIVALLAWARNDAGVDDRDPDPPQATEVVTEADTGPPQEGAVVSDGETITSTT